MSRDVKSASHHSVSSQTERVCSAAASIIVCLFAHVQKKRGTKKSIGQESALIVPPPKPPPRPTDHYSSPCQTRGHERMHVSTTKKNASDAETSHHMRSAQRASRQINQVACTAPSHCGEPSYSTWPPYTQFQPPLVPCI
jgi:hypothetical protein